MLLLFNKYNKDHLQIQTHSEISHARRPLPLSVQLPVPKPPENILAMTALMLMLMKITDSKVGTKLVAVRRMKLVVLRFKQIY
jgi:hypothetical protein